MNPILALDFGRARIGVAISDELRLLAHPLETIPANKKPAERIAEIVREKKVDCCGSRTPETHERPDSAKLRRKCSSLWRNYVRFSPALL